MLHTATRNHFDTIAQTWEQKEWVRSPRLNSAIDCFLRQSERRVGLHQKQRTSALYLGIGTGALFDRLARYHIAGVDRAATMLGRCPEGVIQILADAEHLPFLMGNQFHLAFARNLLKHCMEPRRVLETMAEKTRRDGVVVTIESVVLRPEDRRIPTALVRLTDATHPPFPTASEVLDGFSRAGFSRVEHVIVPYRSRWLRRWIDAEQAGPGVHAEALRLYRTAPLDFLRRHRVRIIGDEIESTVPWLMVRATKV